LTTLFFGGPLAPRPGPSRCRRRLGRALGRLQALGGGAGGVDGDAFHARVEGGVALDDGRVLRVGGERLGDFRSRLAGDEDGVACADGRLRQVLGQGGDLLAHEGEDDGLALLDSGARPADDGDLHGGSPP